MKPNIRPENPRFSSGPCSKRPGWSVDVLKNALLGRSHRSADGKVRFAEAVQKTRDILKVPEGYQIIITPASDTGAMEMALWTMLGARPVDVFGWETFGNVWVTDIVDILKVKDARKFGAPYGELPDFSNYTPDHDAVFTWNGTTSGVRVAGADFIPDDREGLVICDATSAIFSMDIPLHKLDVITYSWQKALGGEAQHGIMILSPRAIERLETYTPSWPLPKLFRVLKGGKVDPELFQGSTINTPSLLCLEDYMDALRWVEGIGGLDATIDRTRKNAAAINAWVAKTAWIDYLCQNPEHRSTTSVCLKITDPWFLKKDEAERKAFVSKLVKLMGAGGAGLGIGAYRAAPPGASHLGRCDGGNIGFERSFSLAGLGLCTFKGRPIECPKF